MISASQRSYWPKEESILERAEFTKQRLLASESRVQKRALKLPTSVSTVAAPSLRKMAMVIFDEEGIESMGPPGLTAGGPRY